VNKIATSTTKLAKCILLHAYSRTTASSPAAREQTKTSYSLFNKLEYFWL